MYLSSIPLFFFLLQISSKIPASCDSLTTEWKRLWNPPWWAWFFYIWKAGMHGPAQWSVLTSLSFRFCRRIVLQSAHWMSDCRLHRGHVAGQRPISGVIVPWQTRSAGRQEVGFNFKKQEQVFFKKCTFKFDCCTILNALCHCCQGNQDVRRLPDWSEDSCSSDHWKRCEYRAEVCDAEPSREAGSCDTPSACR